MRFAQRFRELVIGGSLAALLLVGLPATASAYGYYHYLAWDTYHSNIWPSARPIKRMYWHHTKGGWGVSIKCDIAGAPIDWVWIPISNDGGSGYVGYTNKSGYYLAIHIVRFNGQNGAFTPQPIKDAYAWTRNAWVRMVVINDWEVVGSADEVLTVNSDDSNWW